MFCVILLLKQKMKEQNYMLNFPAISLAATFHLPFLSILKKK